LQLAIAMSKIAKNSISSFAVEKSVEIYNLTSKIYRRRLGRPAKIQVKQWNKVIPQLETEEAVIAHLTLYIKTMVESLDSGGIKSLRSSDEPKEESIVEDYTPETITEMRSRYIAQIMISGEESTLDSGKVRVLLEQKESRHIYRSQVARVMRSIPKFLTSTVDLFGNRLRIKRDPIFNTSSSTPPVRYRG